MAYEEKGELLNDLARLYLMREVLLGKNVEHPPVTSEEKIDELISKVSDKDLQLRELIKMIDRFFIIEYAGATTPVMRYRSKLDFFVNWTVGYKEYGKILTLSEGELRQRLSEDVKRLLERKRFPMLREQLTYLLRRMG